MSPGMQIVLSGVLTFGVPLLFAARELATLKRPPSNPGGPGGSSPRMPPTRPQDGQPGQRPLPACLIPIRIPSPPRRVRVVEPV